MPRWLTMQSLAAEPAWPLARELAVPGRCRGALLRDWAAHVARRAGSEAVSRLRQHTGIDEAALPDQPRAEAWYPIAHQLALTHAIVDVALAGDVLALEPLLAEDTARARDRILMLALRALGPRRILQRASKAHAYLYDSGQAEAEVGEASARLAFSGAAFFANPTWRMLQVFAVRGMLAGFKREIIDLRADAEGADRFALEVAWR